MVATMYRMYEYPAGRMFFITQHEFEEKYLNKPADPHLLHEKIVVDIPERFHSHEHEGRIMLTCGGVTCGIGKFLIFGLNGDPTLEWDDEELGCKHRVSLKWRRVMKG